MILCNVSYEELKSLNNQIINLIDSGNYPDIMVIEPDGNFIKKGQLLDLQKEFVNKSLLGNKRIYIIMHCEKLNSSSANTILKFLEEPEDDIIAFLLTENRFKVLETILSRCQILNLRDSFFDVSCDDDIIELLKAMLDPVIFYKKYNYFINDIIRDKNELKEKFIIIEKLIVNYLNQKHCGKNIFVDKKIFELFNNIDEKILIRNISILEQEITRIDYNVNYKLWLDCLFSRFSIGG